MNFLDIPFSAATTCHVFNPSLPIAYTSDLHNPRCLAGDIFFYFEWELLPTIVYKNYLLFECHIKMCVEMRCC